MSAADETTSYTDNTGTVTYAPSSEHTATIIFLHGRDSSAAEFAPEFFESQASDGRFLQEALPGLKWVFPNAEERHSDRFEFILRQWFDVWSVESPQDRPDIQRSGLDESAQRVRSIIAAELNSIPAERLVIAGISQGAALATYTLSRMPLHENRLAGFMGFCSWIPLAGELSTLRPAALQGMPALVAHSQDDDVVPVANGIRLADDLERMGANVERELYADGGHWFNEPKGVDDMIRFLQKILAD